MSDQYFETREHCPACLCEDTKLVYGCDFLSEPVKTFINLKFEQVVQQYFESERYILKKCKSCDLIYQERIFNETGMSQLYNKWLFDGDRERFDLPGSTLSRFMYYSQELLTIATLFDKSVQDIKLLDYGMGKGQWCSVARDIGYDITGTDVSSDLLEHGRSIGLKVVPLSDFPNTSYDFINTEQVFEHLGKPLEVLESLRDAIEPNGVIKISVPYGSNIENRAHLMDWSVPREDRNFIVSITPGIHINTFSQNSIKVMGEKLGLKLITPRSILSEYRLINAATPKELLKSLLRPIYRRLVGFTYVYLRAQ